MGMFSKVWHAVTSTVSDVAQFAVDAHIAVFTAGANIWGDAAWTWFKHMLIPDMRRDREAMINSATSARRIVYGRTRVGGNLIYAETSGGSKETLNIIVVFTSHVIAGYDEIWFNDQLAATISGGVITMTADFAGFATIELHDGTQSTASAGMLAATAGGWTVDHKLLGCAYGHFQLKYDETKYAAGIPAVKAVLRGKPVYDPRTSTTTVSSNPSINIRDYMLLAPELGGMGCDAAEVPDASIITAANICDQTIAAAGGEKRYTLNGFISLDQTPAAILKPMLSAMSGQALYSGGVWTVYAGASTAPVTTLDESWLNGGISFSTGSNKNDLINTAKGTFTNPDDHWADTEFPAVVDETYLAEDFEELTADLPMPFTNSQTMAQRLARIEIEKSRRGVSVSYPCNLKAAHLDAMDCVAVNNTRLGWSNKLFKIMSWSFSPTGGVDLTLVEDDAGIWADPATYNVLTPPVLTNLPNPRIVAAPTGFTVTEVLYTGVAIANTKSKLDLSWVAADAAASTYEVAFDGVILPQITDTSYTINDLSPGTYDVSVRAKNGIGAVSSWVTVVKVVAGKYAPPSNVAGFSASFDGNLIKLSWTPVNDIDLAGYEIRIGATWASGAILQAALMGNGYTYRPTASGTITHWIKAFDTAGNESLTEATAVAVVPVVDVPTSIVPTAQFLQIDLAITYDLARLDIEGVQIWAATVNDRATAVLVGVSRDGRFQQQGLSNAAFRYYWVRCVNVFSEVGAWYPASATAGVLGATLNDPTQAITLLNSQANLTAISNYISGSGSFSDLVDTFTPAALSGVGTTGVFATKGHILIAADKAIQLKAGSDDVNAQILILDTAIRLKVSTADYVSQIDILNNYIGLKVSTADYSAQVDVLNNSIGLKLNATGTEGAGMLISWSDETHTKSQVQFQTDTFMVGDNTGAGYRSIFTVGNINGTPTVGIGGDAVIDGTLSARTLVADAAMLTFLDAQNITAKYVAADWVYAGKVSATNVETGTFAASTTVTVGGVVIDAGTGTTNGSVRLAKISYASTTAGFWLGNDAGTAKFNIGNATDYLKWNGAALDYTGTIAGNRIIRGTVNSDGTILGGSGFTVTRVSAGYYQIVFSASFSAKAATIPSVCFGSNNSVALPVVALYVDDRSSSSHIVKAVSGTTPTDTSFTFVTVGPY